MALAHKTERSLYYLLDKDKNVVPTYDLKEWAANLEKSNRQVAHDVVEGRYDVSTVFMGIDHSFSQEAEVRPVVFETMVFAREEKPTPERADRYVKRYCTWEEAKLGHEKIVWWIYTGQVGDPFEE